MNGNRRRSALVWLAGLLLLTLGLPGFAAEGSGALSVDEIIGLKQMGFQEPAIEKEVRASHGRYALEDADVRRLQEAGFSAPFVEMLRKRQDIKPIDNGDIARMLKERMALGAILQEIAQREPHFDATPRALLELRRSYDAPQWLLRAMRGQPLGVAEIRALSKDGVPAAEQLLLIDILGVAQADLGTPELLKLLKAGVPGEVVKRLRGTPAVETGADDLPRAGYFPHPLGLFTLRYPEAWRLLKEIEGDTVSYVVTPEQGATRSEDLTAGLHVTVLAVDPEAVVADMSPAQAMEQLLPMLLRQEPALKATGETHEARLGDLPAARRHLSGSVEGKAGEFAGDFTIAFKGNLALFAVSMAPAATSDQYAGAFEEILQRSSFLAPPQADRQASALAAQDLVERYRPGVVSITSYRGDQPLGTGTGFIVREDGYLLTNWHVVWDAEKSQPATRFLVEWDPETGLPDADAELLGYRKTTTYQEQVVAGLSSGIDIALLKLPGDRSYTPLPLVSSDAVRLADPVVTMGYPARDMIQTLSTIVTSGIVTRFNKDFLGKLESIYIDAPIAHGNSGGPALDLMYGRVFGLNTFGSFGIKGTENLWHYFGVVPIDFTFHEFPLATRVSVAREQMLDPVDYYDLALRSRDLGAANGALAVARTALERAPDSADAHYLVGRLQLELAESQEEVTAAFARLDQALALDPKHLPTLTLMTMARLQLGEPDKAEQLADRTVAAHPDDADAYETRARVRLEAKRYQQALADLDRAKELTRKAIPTPYLLAGEIHYAMKKYAHGRLEFEQAARIHPASLEARMGIARYYTLTDNKVAALLEYDKIQRDMPGRPNVLAALARAYQAMNKPDRALESYVQAIVRAQKLGLVPEPETYLEGAAVAASPQVGQTATALTLYVSELTYYWGQPSAFDAHLGLARLLQGQQGLEAVALGHLGWALALRPGDAQATALAAQLQGKRLSLEAIKALLTQLKYPPTLAALVVSRTPLDFTVEPTEETLTELQKIFPAEVALAIVVSQQQQGTADQEPREAPPRELLGDWTAQLVNRDTNAPVGTLRFSFGADGRYLLQTQVQGETAAEGGRFSVAGDRLRLRNDAGEQNEFGIALQGARLAITGTDFGELVFLREH